MTEYYVSISGSDFDVGTITAPFETIQHASDQMVDGDSCIIRKGTYRETVTPTCDNISFYPYTNEKVVINGADIIENWSNYNGDIYAASMEWDMGRGKNQIFVNSKMVYVAHWPSGITDPSYPIAANVTSGIWTLNGTSATAGLIRADLPSGKDLSGATLRVITGARWISQTGIVNSNTDTKVQFIPDWVDNDYADSHYSINPNNMFFLTDAMSLLDSPGMWYFNDLDNTLYLWTTDSSDPQVNNIIEAKRREFGFVINGLSNVIIDGLNLFACTIKLDASTENCLINNINGKYISHFMVVDENHWEIGSRNTGIMLLGSNNQLTNSELAYSAGNLAIGGGSNSIIDNCIMHDAAYAGGDCAIVFLERFTSGHQVTNNILYTSCRNGIAHRRCDTLKILYNEVYNVGLYLSDLGVTYTWRTDGKGTEIAYNIFHDNHAETMSVGIYLDSFSPNYFVHHNVIYGVERGFQLNVDSLNNKIFNNTVYARTYGFRAWGSSKLMDGTEIINNIFNMPISYFPSASVYNNILSTDDPLFVDPLNNNFHLLENSPAINTGVDLNYTEDIDGVTIPQGLFPDIGAYEYDGIITPCVGCCPIPQSEMSVVYTDSEETVGEDGQAINVLDNNPNTFWHTEWLQEKPPHPHEIQLDLGQIRDVCSFKYLSRQDDSENGMIKDFEFYVSNDVNNWGSTVVTGTFIKSFNKQEVIFTTKQGRYVRLIVLNEFRTDGDVTCVAELNVLEHTDDCVPNWQCRSPLDGYETDINNCGESDRLNSSCDSTADPCKGVICQDYCVGTTRYYNGTCDPATGNCIYDVEVNSVACGYEEPCVPDWQCELPLNGYEFDGCGNRQLNSSCDSTSDLTIIPQNEMSVVYADSEETVGEDGRAVNAIDGDLNTFWHTEWSLEKPPYPHEIQLDLGQTYNINAFRYLPRQDEHTSGMIKDFEFYISDYVNSWGSIVTKGTFLEGQAEQEVIFSAKQGRYVRFVALNEFRADGDVTCVAELNVLVAEGSCVPSWQCELPLNGYEFNGCGNRQLNSACDPYVNPCIGITCLDYCDGTTRYYDGACVNGECVYNVEVNSVACGYEKPDGPEESSDTIELLTKVVVGLALLKLLIK